MVVGAIGIIPLFSRYHESFDKEKDITGYHIPSLEMVTEYSGEQEFGKALEGADVVTILAGVPRKPGMAHDDFFNINAGIVKSLATAIAKYYCPHVSVCFP
ncbi:malate dehydrogenase mitochondrial-like [Trifolium medium]|uniref:malate dehydrogenase n=1 Tax=Trifolium medium TaxID=97028 RepID=A0A392MH87_9FABA|nr:malate dehydrogenase mitochondrial-like [Trifolium medium]